MDDQNTPKKLLACAKCYKLHRKCTGESRPCDYCKERKLECVENPDRKKRGRPKGSKNKFKTSQMNDSNINYEIHNIIEITKKRNMNAYSPFPQTINNIEDPRLYQEYQKRQKIIPSNNNNINENYNNQQYPIQYQNNHTSQYQYYQEQQQYHFQNNHPQYISQQRIVSPMINQQAQEMSYIENPQFPSNEFQNTYPPTYIQQQEEEENHYENHMEDHICRSIPITSQSRDLILISELSTNQIKPITNIIQCCLKCNTEMQNFKFCPHCGTPREQSQQKSLAQSISAKKLLSNAILEIVNENNPFMKEDRESSLQSTIWFVVRHPRIITKSSRDDSPNSIPSSPNIMSDFSLFNTIIKQVSPNWTSFLGYKPSESEKIPLSKFIPSKFECSPKMASQWESMCDHTSRNNIVNMSCEFVLCHKFGLMFGVELQITCFSNNGLPDTSFVVVKRHWNLINISEASHILNSPNIDYMSDKAMMDEVEEDVDSFEDPNYELLRKAVDYKEVELF